MMSFLRRFMSGVTLLLLVAALSGCSTPRGEGTAWHVKGSETDRTNTAKYFYMTTGVVPVKNPDATTGEYDPNDKPQYSAPATDTKAPEKK